ncbi:hypothetical protein FOVG_13874 [Fusarium oxysporum f. sp. pisi HDV247]|uniref:Uncharacterized protein n=1 Tax=Fusarium oxysporum f. sp. pisi HDV247 TaxID=1080344 RepID=W9NWL6_FUSOX|nr:hypothetical protein FOVG_13874 [Fusarium oxysporum f. sp. pisi HDV247]
MARSIALAALLYALPIAAQPEITSAPAATAAAPKTTDISFTDNISYSPESIDEDVSLTIVSTITRSNGIDWYAVPISKSNGTVTGSSPSATVDVDNAGAGMTIGTAGVIAGVTCVLAVVL